MDRSHAELVAPADRERHPVAAHPGGIRAEDDVRRRIVGIGVHRIGAVERVTRRKPKIDDFKAYDACVQHCA